MSESEDDLFDSAPIREDQRTSQISSFKISVNSSERRVEEKSGSKRDEVFTTYMVESVSNKTYRVWRRYTNFLQLRQYLEVEHPSCIIPPMPAKRTGDIWNQLTQGRLFTIERSIKNYT
ncbi:Oidioi.mRNA.OKI2018_I69.chr2.g7246.t1.cds [Oikopleura dioica]|uniref:Oidioi.mRNA.OKI2018_I69.chr2.g7246.t1.cds n=1 Tax=Oikopleura dioica TaxID=34765 RepID=A0ABN7T606_OIKDI|nr:Oidioi.mRNA.OKI2018_I69.chr2.g7246.t1.cds [Oikopleura dioica]